MKHPTASALTLLWLSLAPPTASAQNLAWVRRLGTTALEDVGGAASDASGGVYVSGQTAGSLAAQNLGSSDVWLARYDSSGGQTWLRQFGTDGEDGALATASDGTSGVFIGGYTHGSLGGSALGESDAWVARFDAAGNQTWASQLGTSNSDSTIALAPDGSGGLYAAGTTDGSLGGSSAGDSDGWLARYDSLGNQVWIRQFGTSTHDDVRGAAPDMSGGVYLVGTTDGSLGGPAAGFEDAWVARFDFAGNRSWIRQIGNDVSNLAFAAAEDSTGGVYIVGHTGGNLGAPGSGGYDVWLARYDGAGAQTWIRQFGTSGIDFAYAAARDGASGVYIGGRTYGSLCGSYLGGLGDAWLARFDSAGIRTAGWQIGSSAIDGAKAIAADGSCGAYVSGFTHGTLGGPPSNSRDAWLARYETSCGPPSAYCTSSTTTNGCSPSISGTGTASASAGSGFTISVANVEGQKLGLIFYGLNNTSWAPQPWASGSTSYLCVKPPTQRMSSQNSGGTNGSCNGSISIDWNAFIASYSGALGAPFSGGETVFAQGWFRDPAAPKTTNLSNGLLYPVQP